MSALRATLFLLLAGDATSALADQISCESQQGGIEACTTLLPGSRVRLVEQLSRTPCIEGRNWGVDTNNNSIWTSGGCRALFDVRAPRNEVYGDAPYRNDKLRDESRRDEPRRDPSYTSSQYARIDGIPAKALDACVFQAASGQPFGPEQVAANPARWIGHGILSVSLDTPDGPLTCIVDRDGNVRSIDSR